MIDPLIDHLKQYASLKDSIEVERFEATLNQIAELKDPRCIGLLIPFFDDDCDFFEVMYSIIHTIESFDHETFVREVLKSLPDFWRHSPYWATVIHVSILNTPFALEVYRNQLGVADTTIKQISREILVKIRDTKPQFTQRCDELLAVLQ